MEKRIIRVQVTRTFTKTATIELTLPNIVPLEETENYIYNTEETWRESMEKELEKAELEFDPELGNSRYDVYQQVVLEKKIYGGTL
jgi:hypothetical protein